MHVPEASGKLSLTDSSRGKMSAEKKQKKQDMDSKINPEEAF